MNRASRRDNCHLDDEFARLRERLLDPAAWDEQHCPRPELQRDMLDMLLRSLRSECLGQPGQLRVRPVAWAEARAFVDRHHARLDSSRGWKFGCGAEDRLGLVGVVIVGRPVARRLDDGCTLEITRLCTLRHAGNAASMLLGAASRAARALGYARIITYTAADEAGTSLKAAGFRAVARVAAQRWSRRKRLRRDDHPIEPRIRWERAL